MVKDGRFVKAIPRTEYDYRPTIMASEGAVSRTYHSTRVRYPFVRKSYLENLNGDRKPELRGRESFVRVDWDTALGLVSKAILDTIDSHGNQGIFSSSYGGWAHGGVLTPNVLQGRFFNTIGGQSVTVGDYSGGASQVSLPHIVGDMEVYSRQTSWWQILKETEIFVLVGVDIDKNGRVEGRVTDHGMYPHWEAIQKAGVKFISINPQYTTTDQWMNAEWVKIVPNTDTALFLAMAYHIYTKGMHDQAFLDKYTVGAQRYIDYLVGKDPDGSPPKTPEWAAQITGLSADKIRELAELFITKRTEIAGAWSLQRAHHGEMVHWAMINFTCMTGAFGSPGGGVGFSWHWGQGGTLASGAILPGGIPQGKNPVAGICPAGRITEMLENPGKKFMRNGNTFTYPDVGMIYNAGNNVLSHQQDTNRLLKAMQKARTFVNQDPWWVASSRFADIVLPATTTVERDEVSSGNTYSNDKVFAMKKVIEPVGESLDDFEIFRRLAAIFGTEQQFTDGKEVMDIVKESYAKTSASKTTPFEKFWDVGVVQLPVPPEQRDWVRHGDFRTDPEKNPLQTRSGKVEMFSQSIDEMNIDDCPGMPKWLEPAEYLGNAKPGQVHVVSPHPYNRIHSQFAQAKIRAELNIQDREFVLISIEDARKHGIEDGDLVELSNERGAVIAGARVTDKIMEGVVSLYEGAWVQFDSKGRCNSGSINTLTSERRSSGLSQANTANTCIAFLKKAENVEGPNLAYEPPITFESEVVSLDENIYNLDRADGLAEKFTANMEPGEKIFYQRCTLCHVPQDPRSHTKKEWVGLTNSMFPRAGLEDEERKLVLEWLFENAKDGS